MPAYTKPIASGVAGSYNEALDIVRSGNIDFIECGLSTVAMLIFVLNWCK